MHAIRETPATGKASRLEAIKAVAAASASEAASTASEASARVVPEFRGKDFALADARRTVWHAFAPEAMLPQDLEVSQVWSCVDPRAQAGDRMEVLHVGGKWWADVLVMSGARGHFMAKVLRVVEIEEDPALAADTLPTNYRIRPGRPDEGAHLFISERIEDDGRTFVRMNSGLEHRTHSECMAHLQSHPAYKDRPR